MIPEERREKILNLIREEEVCSIKKLVSTFGVSRVTIQRDLTTLEYAGLIGKVHGGAKIVKPEGNGFETRFIIRYRQHYEKKLQIAKKALSFVDSQGCIFLDSSTTVHVFGVQLLKQSMRELTAVTNAPALLHEASRHLELKMISTGGELLNYFSMYAGEWVLDFLNNINIDKAFISAAGISEDLQITTANRELSSILSKVIEKSSEVNLLMDSSKFFRQGMITVGDLSECARLITDNAVTKNQRSKLLSTGIELV